MRMILHLAIDMHIECYGSYVMLTKAFGVASSSYSIYLRVPIWYYYLLEDYYEANCSPIGLSLISAYSII